MIDLWESLFRTLSALAIVLLLIGIATLVARRFLGHRLDLSGGRPLIRVVASTYIAPRKMISLVSVADEYVIVGTTATDLVPLGRIGDSAQLREALAGSAPNTLSSPVASPQSILASWLRCPPVGVESQDKGRHVQ